MITGDNVLTAVSVARQCRLLRRRVPVFELKVQRQKRTVVRERRRSSLMRLVGNDADVHFSQEKQDTQVKINFADARVICNTVFRRCWRPIQRLPIHTESDSNGYTCIRRC
jgi:magnesium-transporting ATPase (P-type)